MVVLIEDVVDSSASSGLGVVFSCFTVGVGLRRGDLNGLERAVDACSRRRRLALGVKEDIVKAISVNC